MLYFHLDSFFHYWFNITFKHFIHTLLIFYDCCDYIGVTRSRKIESDMGYQKNKERVQELKVLWKNEKLLSTINKYTETFNTNTISSFYFTNSQFKDFNTSLLFCVDHHFLFADISLIVSQILLNLGFVKQYNQELCISLITRCFTKRLQLTPLKSPFFTFFFLPPTKLDCSGDENLFHQYRTCSAKSDFFPQTESLGVVTEERECIPGGLFCYECPPNGYQML